MLTNPTQAVANSGLRERGAALEFRLKLGCRGGNQTTTVGGNDALLAHGERGAPLTRVAANSSSAIPPKSTIPFMESPATVAVTVSTRGLPS